MTKGPGRGTVVLLVLTAVGATLLFALPTWATGTLRTATGEVELTAAGATGSPAVLGGALVAGAAALVAAMSGRVGTVVAGAATFVGGVVVVLGAGGASREPVDLLRPEAVVVSGVNNPPVADAAATLWPWGAVVGGAALAFLGIMLIARASRWSPAGRRYERAAAPATRMSESSADGATNAAHTPASSPASSEPAHPGAESAQPAGASPSGTASRSGTSRTGPAGTATPRGTSRTGSAGAAPAAGASRAGSASARADAARDRYVDDWDALGRGEDPTASAG